MKNRLMWLAVALAAMPAVLSGQDVARDTTRLTLDPQVVTGTLPNGLRYYIRENHKPEKRAELQLAVNAGSVVEDSDQLGLAHFTEHMAFNGTRHFEKNALLEYMRSIGMRFGAELNAYTSFDETVYFLTVPTDTGTALSKGFDVLADWAQGQLFDTTEIRKERGVVLEEWRLGRGAGMRMYNKQAPVVFAGSRYADRLVIGTKESITGFDPTALRRFYRDWYRPDLMAVVAVGDFDARKIESMIRERFAALAAPAQARPRPAYGVPGADSIRFALATDKEATNTSLTVLWRIPADSVRTVADYRRDLVDDLYTGMLSVRLSELAQKPDPPFVGAYSFVSEMVRRDRVFAMGTAVKEGGETRGLDALLTEAERVRRHGFTAGELARQKARVLRSLEQAYNERDKTESGRYAMVYVQNFLNGTPAEGSEAAFRLAQRLFPGITLDEVNALSAGFLSGADRLVIGSAPEKSGVQAVTPGQLAAVFPSLKDRQIEAYKDVVADAPLVASLPKGAPIASERELPEVGAREIRLGNGVRVLLKPTDFKADEVMLQAYSIGGSSLLSEGDASKASLATGFVLAGGLGRLSQIDLAKVLAGKNARVFPMITETTQGLSGSASPRDLELLFQLTYLTLTSPRVDSGAFSSYKQRLRAMLENRGASPEQAWSDTLMVVLAQHSARRRPITAARVDSIQYDDALRIYRNRFADAGALRFVLVGSFNVDTVRPLLVKYLGALPSLGRHERPADVLPDAPTGVVKAAVRKGVEQKSSVAIVFSGPVAFGPDENARLNQLASLLSDHLLDVVREELGGTYGISAYASASRLPKPRYQFTINFGCAPDRVDQLTARIFSEIEKIRTQGPDTADVRKTKEQARRTREVSLKQNQWWLTQLYAASIYEWPWSTIPAGAARIEALDAKSIQETARKYLDPKRYVQVVLLPAGVSLQK